MKYSVGDKVMVKNNLVPGRFYGKQEFVEDMKKFSGKEVTIQEVISDSQYFIMEDDKEFCFIYTNAMFVDDTTDLTVGKLKELLTGLDNDERIYLDVGEYNVDIVAARKAYIDDDECIVIERY